VPPHPTPNAATAKRGARPPGISRPPHRSSCPFVSICGECFCPSRPSWLHAPARGFAITTLAVG
jgi:hypothetical protein